MEEVRKHKVYDKVLIRECWDKPRFFQIQVRWVDINKGDGKNLELRSRRVAKKQKEGKQIGFLRSHPATGSQKDTIFNGSDGRDRYSKRGAGYEDRLY